MLGWKRRGRDGAIVAVVTGGFAAVLALFVFSFGAALWMIHSVGTMSASITGNAVPSVLHLSAARTGLRHLELLVDDLVDRGWSSAEPGDLAAVADQLAAIEADAATYFALPTYGGEAAYWPDIRESLGALRSGYDDLRALSGPGEDVAAENLLRSRLKPAADRLDAAIGAGAMFNAARASGVALDIAASKRRAVAVSLAFGALAIVLSVALAGLVLQLLRRYTALVTRGAALEAARARELELFSARVAHDIRGPLGVVKMALGYARRPAPSAAIPAILERGERSLRRTLEIIDALYEFAGSARAPDGATANVRQVLAGTLEDLEAGASASGITLRLEAEDVPPVACRPGALSSIAQNILRNAVKFMGDRPVRQVLVRASNRAGRVRIHFQDSGPGIPERERRVIFEPYARATKGGEPGLGLGLATVKRLAEAHGGRVWVESPREGGALFVVELPTVGAGVVPSDGRDRTSTGG